MKTAKPQTTQKPAFHIQVLYGHHYDVVVTGAKSVAEAKKAAINDVLIAMKEPADDIPEGISVVEDEDDSFGMREPITSAEVYEYPDGQPGLVELREQLAEARASIKQLKRTEDQLEDRIYKLEQKRADALSAKFEDLPSSERMAKALAFLKKNRVPFTRRSIKDFEGSFVRLTMLSEKLKPSGEEMMRALADDWGSARRRDQESFDFVTKPKGGS